MRLLLIIAGVFGCILICQSAGVIGALSTSTGNSPWYQSLTKPFFNPPGWIFAPVWTLLYTLMGISLYLLVRQWPASRFAILFFAVQLILNAAWSPIFFGLHSIGGALITIILLWLTLLVTILTAGPNSAWSAILLLPYLAWVTFATVLNAAIFKLN